MFTKRKSFFQLNFQCFPFPKRKKKINFNYSLFQNSIIFLVQNNFNQLINKLSVFYQIPQTLQKNKMKKLQLTFNQKYKTIHRIGFTKKSEIYKAVNLTNEQEIAVKIEPYSQQQNFQSQIQKQAKIYRLIKGGVGIPNLYWYGVQHNYRVMVTDIYGPSLQHLLKYCQGRFSLKTVLILIDQLIDRIEWIHSKNLAYNDIDPQNFLIGLGKKADKIFVVDYGNCKKFVDDQNNHYFIGKQNKLIKSNVRFRSIHGHIGKKTSRRDDLQSLGYLMVYFLKGALPWDQIEQSQDNQTRDLLIKQNKASISIKNLCEDLPSEFQSYFNYVKTLQFQEQPDYVWIKRLFKDLFNNSGFVDNNIMDWAQRHKY